MANKNTVPQEKRLAVLVDTWTKQGYFGTKFNSKAFQADLKDLLVQAAVEAKKS